MNQVPIWRAGGRWRCLGPVADDGGYDAKRMEQRRCRRVHILVDS